MIAKVNMKRLKAVVFELLLSGDFANDDSIYDQIEVYSFYLIIRQYLRTMAKSKSFTTIVFRENYRQPTLRHYSSNVYNKHGEVIKNPDSYRTKFGRELWWSLLFYHRNTTIVEVGKKWLVRHFKRMCK